MIRVFLSVNPIGTGRDPWMEGAGEFDPLSQHFVLPAPIEEGGLTPSVTFGDSSLKREPLGVESFVTAISQRECSLGSIYFNS